MSLLNLKKAHLARLCGVSRPTAKEWADGNLVNIKSDNLVKLASVLKCSEAWLTGASPVKHRINNMNLVRDEAGDDDVKIAQYQNFSVAAGKGVVNEEAQKPTDYVTFKSKWLKRKGLDHEALVVIYADGNSMEDRIQDGDVVLVDTAQTQPVDGKVFAILYGDEARIKRLRIRQSGNIALISDNDPDGTLREELQKDTFDQLHIIGRALWVGGDLK